MERIKTDVRRVMLDLQPAVQEIIGGPEYFSDGAIYYENGDINTSIFYVERLVGFQIERHEVFRVHFSRQKWMDGMDRTLNVLRQTVGQLH